MVFIIKLSALTVAISVRIVFSFNYNYQWLSNANGCDFGEDRPLFSIIHAIITSGRQNQIYILSGN